MQESNKELFVSKRYLSIDIFKGIAIILMVFVNTLRPYDNIPSWNKHAVIYGMTYVDLIAPFFVFMLVVNTHLSYNKRLANLGRKNAFIRHFRRFFLFIIIGLIFSIDIESNVFILRWGTLQVLGCSGILLLIVIELKYYIRILIAILFLMIHQIFLINGFAQTIYNSVEGGIYGIFAWGSMALFSSIIYDCMNIEKKSEYILITGLFYIIAGLALNQLYPISRQYVSGSYVLTSTGCSALMYNILFNFLDNNKDTGQISINGNFIVNLGKNAFFLFLFHIIIIYIFYQIVPFNTSCLLVFFLAGFNVLIIYFIGYIMDKYKVYFVI
ncbi:MAG: heparan-alpha-glucosaminide N-acetyltransferase domain-containing protein [Candidatus Thorarchaeota archaeon]